MLGSTHADSDRPFPVQYSTSRGSATQSRRGPLRYHRLGGYMQLGIVGLGRMGANMALRLARAGHEVVVLDRKPATVKEIADQGAVGSENIADMVKKLAAPRHIWLMIPAAAVDKQIAELVPLLEPGDSIIDGGNSY